MQCNNLFPILLKREGRKPKHINWLHMIRLKSKEIRNSYYSYVKKNDKHLLIVFLSISVPFKIYCY